MARKEQDPIGLREPVPIDAERIGICIHFDAPSSAPRFILKNLKRKTLRHENRNYTQRVK